MRRIHDSELRLDDEHRAFVDDEPFTGVAYDDSRLPDGTALSEVTYDDGWMTGCSRDYFADGTLAGESWFFENVRHGRERHYSSDGSLLKESLYAFGVRVSPATGDAVDPSLSDLLDRYRRERSHWPGVGLLGG